MLDFKKYETEPLVYNGESKLNLDKSKIEKAFSHAESISQKITDFTKPYTTHSIERTMMRLLGIDGVNDIGAPLSNIVVEDIIKHGDISLGASYYLVNAVIQTGLSPNEIAEQTGAGKLNIATLPPGDEKKIRKGIHDKVEEALDNIYRIRLNREAKISRLGENPRPHIYVLVATGNVYEDAIQAKAVAKHGADIIAVLRSTAQSLLDYVPYGPTTEGFGGTFATQENFRIMRTALDEIGEECGRYIRLSNFASGLCMPEISAMGALEGMDNMVNDAFYGILFRDINMKRTLIDQRMSRMLNGFAGITINTGEDNYLKTTDAAKAVHTVLASNMINLHLAVQSGVPASQVGLSHAFEMDPEIENGFLWELAQAVMTREIFPGVPIKYQPPTKHMTGNIYQTHVVNAMYNLSSIWSNQGMQLLGMPTEGIHTPHIHDRFLSIQSAKYIYNNAKDIGDEIMFKPDGIIQKRAQQVLDDALLLLEHIDEIGLFKALSKGVFGDICREPGDGKGMEGIVEKNEHYYNPIYEMVLGEE